MLFIVDFDGTVAPRDTVDALLQNFAGPEWEELERDWIDGRINSQQCMTGQIALVRGDDDRLREFLESVHIDPAFPSFVEYVRPFADVVIVSDGLDYPIRHALARAGLDVPVVANGLAFRDRGLAISFPHFDTACTVGSGVCKCAATRRANTSGGTVVLIGDGKSDACIARIADVVFAKDTLRSICESTGIPHIPFASFADVLATVAQWSTNGTIEEPRCPLTTLQT